MPFDVKVTLEDGGTGIIQGVPDGTSPEAVHAVAAQQFQKPIASLEAVGGQPPAGGALDKAGRIGAIAGGGVLKGMAGLGNLAEIPVRKAAEIAFGDKNADLATALVLHRQQKMSRDLNQALPAPQTTGEKYLDAAAQGVGGTIPTLGAGAGVTGVEKVASILRQLAVGAVSGAGGEAGANALPTHPEVGRVLGSVAGGVGASGLDKIASEVAARVAPTSAARQQIVDLITRNVSPSALESGAATMRDVAKNNAINLTGAQAIPGTNALDELQSILAQHPQGENVQATLRAQPTQVSLLASQLEGSGGGVASSKSDVVRRAQAAADDFLQAIKGRARAAFGKEVAGGTPAAQADVAGLDKQLQNYADQNSEMQGVQQLVGELRSRLRNPDYVPPGSKEGQSAILDAAGKPLQTTIPPEAQNRYMDDALKIKNSLGEVFSDYSPQSIDKSGKAAVDTFHQNNLRDIVGGLYEQGGGKVAAANKAYSGIMRDEFNPAAAGPVGKVAGKYGLREDVPSPEGPLFGILGKGTTNPQKSDIRELGRALTRQSGDPQVFPDIVSTYIDHTVKNVSDAGTTGLDYVGKINNAFFGSEAKRQGLRDMVAASAEGRGLSPEEMQAAVSGIDKYAQIFKMASKVPGKVGGVTASDIQQAAGATPGAEIAAIGSHYMPLRLINIINQGKADQALSFMDKLITTPEGMELLAKMGREKGLSQGWANLMSSGFSTLGIGGAGGVSPDTPRVEQEQK